MAIETMQPEDPVEQIMERGVATVDQACTAREAAEEMTAAEVGALLVDGPHGTVGIVSERDLTGLLGAGGDPDRVQVRDLMSTVLVQAGPSDPIREVAGRMVAADVRHVPIVARGRPVGMVSVRDMLTVLSNGPIAAASAR